MKTAFVYAMEPALQNYNGDIFEYFRETALRRSVDHVVVFDSIDCAELDEFHDELCAYANAAPREFPPVYFMTQDFGFISRVMDELSSKNAHVAFEFTPAQRNALHSRA